MFPLVILSFPPLILVYFLVICCYQLFSVLLGKPWFISQLRLPNLGFTWVNSVRTQIEIISDPNYLVRILFER